MHTHPHHHKLIHIITNSSTSSQTHPHHHKLIHIIANSSTSSQTHPHHHKLIHIITNSSTSSQTHPHHHKIIHMFQWYNAIKLYTVLSMVMLLFRCTAKIPTSAYTAWQNLQFTYNYASVTVGTYVRHSTGSRLIGVDFRKTLGNWGQCFCGTQKVIWTNRSICHNPTHGQRLSDGRADTM